MTAGFDCVTWSHLQIIHRILTRRFAVLTYTYTTFVCHTATIIVNERWNQIFYQYTQWDDLVKESAIINFITNFIIQI